MKIYLKNYIVGDVIKKIAGIDRYYTRTNHIIEIFSEEGMYQVTANKIYKLNTVDEKITNVMRSDGVEIIVDKSTISSVEAYHVPAHHIMIPSSHFIYQLKPNGTKLIIEGSYSTKCSCADKYVGFLPSDFYFEVNSEIDDLNGFLSLLK
jgi:galactitol-specific phosphotransferase system IIB component